MPRPTFLLALLPLAACAGSGGSYPSLQPRAGEVPRIIEAPGESVVPALAPEQQASLQADLARERKLLDETEAELRQTAASLDRALAALRGNGVGTEPWSTAQMALSRHDLARGPLVDIRARLAPLQRSVDSLPATDPDRQAIEALAARAALAAETAQKQIDSANRSLAR
jgi:hypothetical protein